MATIDKIYSRIRPRRLRLFNPLRRLRGVIWLIIRREQNHLGLMTLALLGIVLTVGLVTDAYFFSKAVDRVILKQELADFSEVTGRPPFSTNVYVFPSNRKPVTLEQAETLSKDIANILTNQVQLPLLQNILLISSGTMMLQPESESGYEQGNDFLGSVKVIYLQDIAEYMQIDAGAKLDEDNASGEVMDVWMHNRIAQEMGLQIGDKLIVRFNLLETPVPIQVAGIWHAKSPEDEYWFNAPDTLLKDALIVRRQDYLRFIQPILPSGSREASWYIILDEEKINPKNGSIYLAGFEEAKQIISRFLPGVRLNAPPLNPLNSFVQRSRTLTVLLLGYNLPAYIILLYFLALTSGTIAQWQRKETSILVSRGMSIGGILNLTLLEELLLFVIGYPLGVAFGMLTALIMGYTASFLNFTIREPLPVSFNGLSIPLTVLALGIALVMRLIPAAQATRQSVVTEEREWARPSEKPFWYRYYLDFLLVLPTYYLYDQIVKRGLLSNLIVNSPNDIYREPLLILIPALFIVTASLLGMRLFSLGMRLIDILANLTPWLTLHLALRQLGRQSQDYIRPLLLVIVCLALGVYTISMAASLDQWMIDRIYYRIGTDLTFTPKSVIEGQEFPDGNWIPKPAQFLNVPGVTSAARLGEYYTRITLPQAEVLGKFLALDRLDFPLTAWFRPDFAEEPLGGLMNRLALTPEGILVSRQFLALSGFQIGDQISVQIDGTDTYSFRSSFVITGVYDYFPTVYEQDENKPYFIGNLDHLNDLFGFILPHQIWLKLEPGISGKEVRLALPSKVGVSAPNINDARAVVAEEQGKIERVGIFGTLTVGFLASVAMAIIGLLVYSYASLRDRLYRFVVLQSIGLLRRQIFVQVILEYSFLAIFGAAGGALIGGIASQLFIPFFRYTGERGMPLPPLIPVIARQTAINLVIAFGVVIVLAEVLTIAAALRKQLVRIG